MSRAVLYRCRTPTDRLCACGRVARELRRQGIEADELRVPWRRRDRAAVHQASGQRTVPLLVIDGEAICDSHRIVEHLRWRAGRGGAGQGTAEQGGEQGADAEQRGA